MDLLSMIRIKEMAGRFCRNHPKLVRFCNDASGRMDAGSIIEIKITMSNGEVMKASAKVRADDVELLEYFRKQKL